MNKEEARAILAEYLGRYRNKPYEALKKLIGKTDAFQISAANGTVYQIEIQAYWDDEPDGNIRLMGAIDDGGWSAFAPLCDDFIMSPDGTFPGE